MDITELKSQIMKNELGHFYVFVGEEIGIINIYLNQIAKTTGMKIVRADSVLSVYTKCTSRSLFNDSAGLYVIRNDTDFIKQEKVYETIESDIRDNIIILLYDKLDSRLKFVKYFKDRIVTFEKLAPNVLISYVKKASGLSDSSAAELSNTCDGCYDLAMLEIDKVKQYCQALKLDVDAGFKSLLREGVIYHPVETDGFKFVEALMSKDINEAFNLYYALIGSGGQSINLLGILYNAVKSTLLIQLCDGKNVSEVTGLDKGQIYFNRKYVGNFDTAVLVATMKKIIEVVSGIKSGFIDDAISVPYIMVVLMSGVVR